MPILLGHVRRVVPLGGDSHVVEVEGAIPPTAPGQFFMLRPQRPWSVLLPRPFSLFGRSANGGLGTFLLKTIGPATSYLAQMRPGEGLWMTGPLGNRLPAVASGAPEPVCVAGGVGLAPFLLWCEERRRHSSEGVDVLFGARTAAGLAGMDSFPSDAVRWSLATDDGSRGLRGTVIHLLEQARAETRIGADTPVYCCGPDPMMHAVVRWCQQAGLACWLSLETYMACGYGVCNGCSVAVRGSRFGGWPYAKTCIEGPVFAAADLVLEH
jgi:dihydroorotate dehydrogenase electron transfer subunit